MSLQEIISMNEALFKLQLGCCNTFKAILSLREGALPKYCKIRKLPFALKPVVGAELDRLEKEQELEKVTHYAKQKQPGCKKSARPIRSHNGYKRPKSLISSKAKKLNILLRILLLE